MNPYYVVVGGKAFVGQQNFIVKTIEVRANNPNEAEQAVRNMSVEALQPYRINAVHLAIVFEPGAYEKIKPQLKPYANDEPEFGNMVTLKPEIKAEAEPTKI